MHQPEGQTLTSFEIPNNRGGTMITVRPAAGGIAISIRARRNGDPVTINPSDALHLAWAILTATGVPEPEPGISAFEYAARQFEPARTRRGRPLSVWELVARSFEAGGPIVASPRGAPIVASPDGA
jgi:hypothetical protein